MTLICVQFARIFILGLGLLACETHAQPHSPDSPAPAQPIEDQSFYLGQAVSHPEALSGIWEAPDGRGGAVGIHLMLDTTVAWDSAALAGARQSWQDLQVGVYERTGHTAPFSDENGFSDSPRGGSVRFESGRLTLHFPSFDLNLVQLPGDRWSGRLHRQGFDSHVVLGRPHLSPSAKTSWIVGTWREEKKPNYNCLHIGEQARGEFTGWSDSLSTWGTVRVAPHAARPVVAHERYGIPVQVHSATAQEAVIELYAFGGLCCSHTFIGTPTNNYTLMQADWPPGANQAPYRTLWAKMPGATCIRPGH